MKIILKRISTGLLVTIAILVLSGIIMLANNNDELSTELLFLASLVFPFLIAAKGIEFIIDNQLIKASMSFLLLSLVCVLSLILVFG
ncbi:MAG: hypothetical protein K0M50_08605 [Prolixibacteraceae bacterium]|nr:hypothetical protein [Prolixibacteraceae bacterium]